MNVQVAPLERPDFEPDVNYVDSPNLGADCEQLIRRHPRFDDLKQLRIAYLERLGEIGGQGEAAIAKCQKASPLWRDVAGVDAVIWVWREWWAQATPREREAVAGHELCHLSVTEQGTVKILEHDVEEFAWVVAQYGTWEPGRALFVKAAIAGDERLGGPVDLESRRADRRPGQRRTDRVIERPAKDITP